ncbi:MAG: septum formation initiator family protein [Desulfovibrionaceae bacterium]|nr:septum formation initiator family protein [Desulfovibrionaceae bacterium]
MVNRVVIFIIFIIVNIVFAYQAVWGERGLLAHDAIVARYNEAKERCAQIDKENMALSREIRLLKNDRPYIEKMIREKLRYLHDNEILYLFGDDDGTPGETQANGGKHER